MTDPVYETVFATPSIQDYCRLRRIAGMSEKTEEAAEIGLKATWFAVQILHQGKAVGMGRMVGDGGCHMLVCDIAVDPAHQGRGLGKRIMGEIVTHMRANLPKSAYVSLIADGKADQLYAQFGFEHTAPKSVGMACFID